MLAGGVIMAAQTVNHGSTLHPMPKSNPALDALRRNVSGKVESGESTPIVGMPIIDATTLAYALDHLLTSAGVDNQDMRDLRRILANLPAETVRTELDGACVRWLKS